jgi:hypothetical protein
MYSTLDGAKIRAKQLKRLLAESGLSYSLVKCQAAVAAAGGYADWHAMAAQINDRGKTALPFDYWGRLVAALPESCRHPVRMHLLEERGATTRQERWVRDVLPYLVSLEVVHRISTPSLLPGSGRDQMLRLHIASGLLLNVEGCQPAPPQLDPDNLTVTLRGEPAELLPKLAAHPRFSVALETLISEGVISIEQGRTCVLAPAAADLRREIVARARSWNAQQEPRIDPVGIDQDLAANLQHQLDIDRADSGPKVAYDERTYEGILLQSRSRLHTSSRR